MRGLCINHRPLDYPQSSAQKSRKSCKTNKIKFVEHWKMLVIDRLRGSLGRDHGDLRIDLFADHVFDSHECPGQRTRATAARTFVTDL